jgi:hypothetical protein
MSKAPGIFNLHEVGNKNPHLFGKEELPKSLFLALNHSVESQDGIPEANITITQFIRLDLIKGKPYENEIREMINLPPRS